MDNIQCVCGTCRWHKCDGSDWICLNVNGDRYAEYTNYSDECEEWEGRQ